MFNRSFKHWTTRYIIDRLKLMFYERTHPDDPWLCPDAVRMLDSWLRTTDRGLEWGSGRSTVWLSTRIAHLTSVEHNPQWAQIVAKKLDDHGITNNKVDSKLFPDGKEERADCDYVNVVSDIAPGSLDFCLVDGVSRDHCALACLEELKPGGILIIDNINRYLPKNPKTRSPESRGPEDGFASAKWEEFASIVKDWRCIWSTNGIWDTSIWVKEGS